MIFTSNYNVEYTPGYYGDRLPVHLLLTIIKLTFKHVISQQSSRNQTQVKCRVCPRTYHRILDSVVCCQARAMPEGPAHPVKMQRYFVPILIWSAT